MDELLQSLDTITGQKAAATKLLDMLAHAGYIPPDDDTLGKTPVLRMAEMTIKEIQKNGGKISSSLVGMLCHADDLAAALRDINQLKNNNKSFEEALEVRSELAMLMADEILSSGLVELPIVARGRGQIR